MAEGGWLICVNPRRMLAFLRGIRKASDRKQLLFAVACYRRIWDSLSDQDRQMVRVAERYADGRATWEEMSEATIASAGRATKIATRLRQFVDGACATALRRPAVDAYRRAMAIIDAGEVEDAMDPRDAHMGARSEEQFAQEQFLRDLFGNPFRPTAADPAWLTPGVLELAGAIYDEGAFDRLPALADALEAAGCHDPDWLGHLRGPGPHLRGCWAVDLVLGKP